jgi:hypothetical protein
MKDLYAIAGISKQGFHRWLNRYFKQKEEQALLKPLLDDLRNDHPRLSCRKLYHKLSPDTMGRDSFEEFCYEYGLKIEQKRARFKTTYSMGTNPFPNLLLSLDELTGINQLWVSDITYYFIGPYVYYLTFIIDIFNREIIGYAVSRSLRTEETSIAALQMAIKTRSLSNENALIFHSDGGGQFYSTLFKALTQAYNIKNSMGKTAYENPHAERVNGIIKNDYLIPYGPDDYKQLTKFLTKAVELYNEYRPHDSLDGHSPREFLRLVDKKLLTKTWIVNKKKKVSKKEKVNITIK